MSKEGDVKLPGHLFQVVRGGRSDGYLEAGRLIPFRIEGLPLVKREI